MSRRRVAGLLAVMAGAMGLSLASLSSAQPDKATATAASPASASAQLPAADDRGPALVRVSRAVARDIVSASAGALVVGAPLVSDATAPRGNELVARVVSLIAGALGPEVRAGKSPSPLDQARADASSAKALVYVQVELARGELRASADVFPIPRNIWDRSRNPSPGPVAHGYGAARTDAEVRSHLAPIPLVASETLRVPLPEPEVLALLCDDVDGDDALELVLASRRSVLLGRIRGGRFEAMRKVAWESLSPIAPAPWREPMISMARSLPGMFDVGATDRARSVRLDGGLELRGELTGIPIPHPGGVACGQLDVGAVSRELVACTRDETRPSTPDVGFAFDASAADSLIRADGRVDGVMAVRRVSDTSLVLRDLQGRTATVPNVGAQVAVADLDLDGEPEVLASRNVLEPGRDGLVIRTWRAGGAVQDRLTIPVAQGVSAIAVCPSESSGMRAIAMATSTELWLIR